MVSHVLLISPEIVYSCLATAEQSEVSNTDIRFVLIPLGIIKPTSNFYDCSIIGDRFELINNSDNDEQRVNWWQNRTSVSLIFSLFACFFCKL